MRMRNVSGTQLQRHKKQACARGQGVVEYAGALVIAALIVAAGLTVLPPNVASYLQGLQVSMMNFLLNHMPA